MSCTVLISGMSRDMQECPQKLNGKQGLLIDDRDKYVNEFREGGGIAIKHNPDDVDNTIRQLKELGL